MCHCIFISLCSCHFSFNFSNFSLDVRHAVFSRYFRRDVLNFSYKMDLDDAIFNETIKNKLIKAGYETVEDILLENPHTLLEKTHLFLHEISDIYSKISKKYFLQKCLIRSYHVPNIELCSRLSLGCTILNKKLNGGLYPGGIYEFFGECGSGKTQICLQISLELIVSSRNSIKKDKQNGPYVCYICTDDAFPISRLGQLLEYRYHIYKMDFNKIFDKILIYHAVDLCQVCDCMIQIKRMLEIKEIGVIIVDSIAGCSRLTAQNIEYNNRERTKYFAKFKRLFSECFELANRLYNRQMTLICTNQVVDAYLDGVKCGINPCLGLSWTNIISSRIFLKRLYPLDDTNSFTDMSWFPEMNPTSLKSSPEIARIPIDGTPRILKIVFSTHHFPAPSNCLFTISSNGIDGINTVEDIFIH